jgi:putative methyltransferase (TIGR04325 family)
MRKKILLTIPNANVKNKVSFWKLAINKNIFKIYEAYQWKKRIKPNFVEKFFEKIKMPIDISGFNKKIIKIAKKNPDLEYMLVEKGWYINFKTLQIVRSLCPMIKLIYFSNDNMILKHNTNFFLNKIFKSNIFDKINLMNISKYKNFSKYYKSNVVYTDKSYSKKIHLGNLNPKKNYKYDVSFIGTFTPDRLETFLFLEKNNIKLSIWGYGWKKYKFYLKKSSKIYPFELYNNNYKKTIQESKINISFLRKENFDTQTSRSIEIPAAGGFILTKHTKEHERIYGSYGKKILFKSNQDLAKKIKLYLGNDKLRNVITKKIHTRVIKNIKSYEDKILDILETNSSYPFINYYRINRPLKSFFYKVLHEFNKFYFQRKFNNFNDCNKFCIDKVKNNYDNTYLNYFRYHEFRLMMNDIKNLRSNSFYLLKMISKKIKKNNKKILELGGGFGSDFLNLKKFDKSNIQYKIVETKSILKIVNKNRLNYCKFLNYKKKIFEKKFDIIYVSATLQYFRNPYNVCNHLFQSSSTYIILANNNFSFNPKIYSQYSFYSQNLSSKFRYNIHSDLISNKFSIYPNVQYSENLITCIANKYSYKLIYDFPGIESFAKNSYSKSLVFKKES